MNIKSLPHKIAAILFLIGVIVTYLGSSILSQDIQIFQNSSGDGAIPALYNFIIGGIITLVGGIFTIFLLISWAFGALIQLFARLIKLFGAKYVFLFTLGTVTVLLWVYFFSGFFEKQIYVGALEGSIYSKPRFTAPKDIVLSPTDKTLKIIHITDSISKGYPWFFVSYGKSAKGYMWGGNLCAKEYWINGLGGRCESYRLSSLSNEFDYYNVKKDQNIADVIEILHRMLPSIWDSEYKGQYEFTSQKEIIDKGMVIGWWSINVGKDFFGHPSFELYLDYIPELNESQRKFQINFINQHNLTLQESFLSKYHYNRR